jgi:hypothetical protein
MVIVRVVEVCVCMCVDGGWSRVGSTPPAAVYGKKEKKQQVIQNGCCCDPGCASDSDPDPGCADVMCL